MTVKELSQHYYLTREIENEKKRLEDIKNNPDSYGDDTFLISVISSKIEKCMHTKTQIEEYISSIPDSMTRQIFTYRFINRLSWTHVARRIGGNNTGDSVRMICKRYIGKHRDI